MHRGSRIPGPAWVNRLKRRHESPPSGPSRVVHLPRASGEEVEPLGCRCGLQTVGYAQLCDDVGDVDADRALADEQASGDLLVREALGEDPQDVALRGVRWTGMPSGGVDPAALACGRRPGRRPRPAPCRHTRVPRQRAQGLLKWGAAELDGSVQGFRQGAGPLRACPGAEQLLGLPPLRIGRGIGTLQLLATPRRPAPTDRPTGSWRPGRPRPRTAAGRPDRARPCRRWRPRALASRSAVSRSPTR